MAFCNRDETVTREDLADIGQLAYTVRKYMDKYSTAFKGVVLNACDTHAQGETLVAYGVPAVVCTKGKIGDRLAVEFPQAFYHYIAKGYTVEDAHTHSCEELQLVDPEEFDTMRGRHYVVLLAEVHADTKQVCCTGALYGYVVRVC